MKAAILSELSREDIVTLSQSVKEFRDEYAGPHHDENAELGHKMDEVLRNSIGDSYLLIEVTS